MIRMEIRILWRIQFLFRRIVRAVVAFLSAIHDHETESTENGADDRDEKRDVPIGVDGSVCDRYDVVDEHREAHREQQERVDDQHSVTATFYVSTHRLLLVPKRMEQKSIVNFAYFVNLSHINVMLKTPLTVMVGGVCGSWVVTASARGATCSSSTCR